MPLGGLAVTHESARNRAAAAAEELAGELVNLTQEMVRIPTETHPPHGDEGPGQEHLADYLTRRFGWEVDVFLPTDVEGIEGHPGWWPGLDYTNRPNVVARRRGVGGGRSIILNGHIDVVPAGPAELWTYDPYGAEIANGKIYGRGSVDMKGGIAAMIYAVRAVEHAGIRLRGDVIIESVVNEELGGYNGTLACCLRGYAADAAIVTEGTLCQIMPAHKGGQGLRLRVPGRGAHANLWWRGVSALDKALLLKQVLADFESERAAETRHNPYFSDEQLFPIPALVDTVWSLSAGHPEVMSPPEEAVLDFWCDALPSEELDTIVDRLEARLNAAADNDPFLREHRPILERRAIMRPFYPTAVPLDHPIISTLTQSYQAVTGGEPRIFGLSGVCDAMMFNLHSNTPAIIFGPGDVAKAHSPDEYIEIDELVRAAKIMAHLIVDWCGVA
jgi:acetylornithine deacetylase